LLSIDYTPVAVGAALVNLDAFVSARYAAQAAGSTLTNWIVRPAVAEVLSKLKVETGSNQSVLQFVDDGIVVAGLPVLVSDQVDAGTVAWGVPSAHVKFVTRKGSRVEKFPESAARWHLAPRCVASGRSVRQRARRYSPGVVAHRVHAELRWRYRWHCDGQGEQPRLERATIAFNAAASVVKTAIVGIDDSILAADVTVTGSAGVYTVTVPGVLTVATAPPSQVVPLPR
jgi:hypothetical protein